MAKKKTKPTGAVAAAPQARPEGDELQDLNEFARQYGKHTVIVVVAVAIVAIVVTLFRNQKRTENRQASDMLTSARSPQQLNELLGQYPSARASAMALLKLARAYYDESQFSLARSTYERFLTEHPQHEMRGVAELGKLHCLEADGQTEAALAGLESFCREQSDPFLLAQAVLGRGRCLARLGRWDEARAVYEDYVSAKPEEDGWSREFEQELARLKAAERRAQRTPAPGAAPQAGESSAEVDISGFDALLRGDAPEAPLSPAPVPAAAPSAPGSAPAPAVPAPAAPEPAPAAAPAEVEPQPNP
ncbi:MAG: tetratricopeptide repeat protein [Kiritimatiellae bacterium]|nr:tetratricopeptide repeat protein [Kiritimatiellia bacterium]